VIRVVVEHHPDLFSILGYVDEAQLNSSLSLVGRDGVPHTYYRSRSTTRWVLYRAAITGHGEVNFHPEQR